MGNINRLKNKWEPIYKSIGSVWCPAIKDNVLFNNWGWKHIRYDGQGHRREPSSIAMRFNLLPYALEVVKKARYVEETTGEVSLNGGKRKVTYFELIKEVTIGLKTRCVTVVLRKIEDGKVHYLSSRYTSEKDKKALVGLL